jgi:hypothetical protein
MFLADLTSEGVKVDHLCLGQALTDQVGRVAAALNEQPSFRHIRVYASGEGSKGSCADLLDGWGLDKRAGLILYASG